MTRVTVEIQRGAPKYISEIPGGEPIRIVPGRVLSVDSECFDEAFMVVVGEDAPEAAAPEIIQTPQATDDTENEWVLEGTDDEEE